MPIDDLLSGESAIVTLRAREADEVLGELALALAEQTGLSSAKLASGLREREALGSTAIGRGLALPHTKAEITGSRAVLGIAAQGIAFGAPDDRPVRVFVALVSSMQPSEHLRALASVSRWFADPSTIDRISAAERASEVLAILRGEA
ncbi:PTS sugar transporter subunit IIA [Nannocystaceae bacterium ST9]